MNGIEKSYKPDYVEYRGYMLRKFTYEYDIKDYVYMKLSIKYDLCTIKWGNQIIYNGAVNDTLL